MLSVVTLEEATLMFKVTIHLIKYTPFINFGETNSSFYDWV